MPSLFKAFTSPANASYVTMAIQGLEADVTAVQSALDSLGYVSYNRIEEADTQGDVLAFYDVANTELSQFETDYINACEGL